MLLKDCHKCEYHYEIYDGDVVCQKHPCPYEVYPKNVCPMCGHKVEERP